MSVPSSATEAWNAEYRRGRYVDEPPVALVDDILAAAAREGITIGFLGLDISDEAVRQLARRRPDRAGRLRFGDMGSLPAGQTWPLVIGIQVFQHGDRAQAHRHVRAAQQRVEPGGLLCLRVNATGTHVWPAHDVVERHRDQCFTVRYTAGPKNGLNIHFFSADELGTLFGGWQQPLAIRADSTERTPPALDGGGSGRRSGASLSGVPQPT